MYDVIVKLYYIYLQYHTCRDILVTSMCPVIDKICYNMIRYYLNMLWT